MQLQFVTLTSYAIKEKEDGVITTKRKLKIATKGIITNQKTVKKNFYLKNKNQRFQYVVYHVLLHTTWPCPNIYHATSTYKLCPAFFYCYMFFLKMVTQHDLMF